MKALTHFIAFVGGILFWALVNAGDRLATHIQ